MFSQKILQDGELEIVRALGEVTTDRDDVAKSLVRIFHSQRNPLKLLNTLTGDEVDTTRMTWHDTCLWQPHLMWSFEEIPWQRKQWIRTWNWLACRTCNRHSATKSKHCMKTKTRSPTKLIPHVLKKEKMLLPTNRISETKWKRSWASFSIRLTMPQRKWRNCFSLKWIPTDVPTLAIQSHFEIWRRSRHSLHCNLWFYLLALLGTCVTWSQTLWIEQR